MTDPRGSAGAGGLDRLEAELNRIAEAHRLAFARHWVGTKSYPGIFGAVAATGRGVRRRAITADSAVLVQARADYARFLAAVIDAALDHCRQPGLPFEDIEASVRRAVAAYVAETAAIIRPTDGTGALTPGVAAALEAYRAGCRELLESAVEAARLGRRDPRLAAAAPARPARSSRVNWVIIFLLLLLGAWFLFGRVLTF